ncbi:MAG: ATP-binding protein [Gammaproteobacteria bacterium]|nr:ATP-binding protein [Gammaproteobacteria bacterium]
MKPQSPCYTPSMGLINEHYIDEGQLRGQDDVPLHDFLAQRDRAQLSTGRGVPFFSGREREISTFRQMANALLLDRRSNATPVVEGPPGAGKSALLAQFMEEMRAFPSAGSGNRRWLPVLLNGAHAEMPLGIGRAVDSAIARRMSSDLLAAMPGEDADVAERLRAFLGEDSVRQMKRGLREIASTVMDRGFGALGVRVGGASSDRLDQLEHVADRRAKDWSDWQIVLLIDEAQQISDQAPGAIPGTLSSIHQGFVPASISFCAFGLPGTWDALGDVGISRGSVGYDLPLAGLNDEASQKAVHRCFSQYQVENANNWERAILKRSANWPQHLAVYLNAALTTLECQAGASGAKKGLDKAGPALLPEAMALGDEGRKGYYDRRVRGLDRHNARHSRYARHLAPLLREGGGEMHLDDVVDYMEGAPLNLPPSEVDGFISAAQHSGFLERLPGSRLRMPIPSFAAHLLGEPMPPLPEAASPRPKKVNAPCQN